MELPELFRTIHKAIEDANNTFIKWTGRYWLQAYGVEGFLVARIADAIMNPKNPNRPGFLMLETPFDELYDAAVRPRGNPGQFGKKSNRIDIALYHRNGSLSHVIEVKRYWSPASCKDLNRLCKLYKTCGRINNGPLRAAIYVQLLDVGIMRDDQNIFQHFTTLENKCREYISKKHGLGINSSRGIEYYKPIKDDENAVAFSSFCLSICQ